MAKFDVSEHLSAEARRRPAGKLVALVEKFSGQEGVIGMHGGLPPSDVFPLTAVEYTFRAPPSPPSPTPNGTATATNGVSPPRNGAATASSARVDDPATLAALQQYNLNFDGFAPLREWLAGLMSTMQAPVHPDWGVLLANGALHSIELVLRTFLEPGDTVYVEEFAFSQVLEGLMAPMGLRCVGVRMDGEGLLPDSLDELLTADQATPQRTRLLYTVPHGHNPTGATMSPARKEAVYAVCTKHDVLILEDDPYCYLQYPAHSEECPGKDTEPGFSALDHDGRVVRVDTFSKCLAPGLRLGWITAPAATLAPLKAALIAATVGPSGQSVMAAHALTSTWGLSGFDAHLRALQARYRASARVLHAALGEHCAGLAEWAAPEAGMFVWLRVTCCEDVETDIMDELIAHKVVIVPGRIFHVRGGDPQFKCPYARLAFCGQSDDGLREGARRLGEVLREHKARQGGQNGKAA